MIALITPRYVPRPAARRLGAWGVALALVASAFAAEIPRKKFDLPADIAARSIKMFAQLSGAEVLISAELGREIRTQPVKGEFTPREALERMLAGTVLTVRQDEKTGVFAIMRANGGAAAPAKKKSRRRPRRILPPPRLPPFPPPQNPP